MWQCLSLSPSHSQAPPWLNPFPSSQIQNGASWEQNNLSKMAEMQKGVPGKKAKGKGTPCCPTRGPHFSSFTIFQYVKRNPTESNPILSWILINTVFLKSETRNRNWGTKRGKDNFQSLKIEESWHRVSSPELCLWLVTVPKGPYNEREICLCKVFPKFSKELLVPIVPQF